MKWRKICIDSSFWGNRTTIRTHICHCTIFLEHCVSGWGFLRLKGIIYVCVSWAVSGKAKWKKYITLFLFIESELQNQKAGFFFKFGRGSPKIVGSGFFLTFQNPWYSADFSQMENWVISSIFPFDLSEVKKRFW